MEKEKYTDIHCHVLPGVDDGACDMQEALALLRCAAAENVGKIILTPHQKPDRRCVSPEGMQRRMAELQKAADQEKLGIRLYSGGELFYRQGLEQELSEGKVCTLAGSRYVLVEFYPREQFEYIRNGIYSLLAAGYLPVLAHAERYEQVCRSREHLEELLGMGCYYQVNAGSLTGNFGWGMKRTAWGLVREQMVSFVATDAHKPEGKRAAHMEHCARMLQKKCGENEAEKLLYGNAEKIFTDEEF